MISLPRRKIRLIESNANVDITSMKDTASKSAQCVTDYTTLQEIAKSWKSFLPKERNSTALS